VRGGGARRAQEVSIDWDFYKGKVDDKLLTTLHKALTGAPLPYTHSQAMTPASAPARQSLRARAGLKIPKYDISGALKEVDDVFAPILAEAKELEAFSAKRAKEIEAEIAAVDRDIVHARSAQSSFQPRPAACQGSDSGHPLPIPVVSSRPACVSLLWLEMTAWRARPRRRG
jgi:hypothetical protein